MSFDHDGCGRQDLQPTTGPRGHRVRQANLLIDIAGRTWRSCTARRRDGTAENPWKGAERDATKKTKPAATSDEAYALAEALKAMGEPTWALRR